MKAYIIPNLDKTNCESYTREACEILAKHGIEICMDVPYRELFSEVSGLSFNEHHACIRDCDVIIVIGGDGTILHCAQDAATAHKPILGINCGRLGFMTSLEHDDLELLKKLKNGSYTVSPRMMIKLITSDGAGFNALNDIVIQRSDDCKIADFEVSKAGQTISYLRADGVIFSTATGSTAYSMSAGGSIIEPEMQCIEYTQMCAHSLFARSMILSPDSEVTVTLHTRDGSHALVYVDGNTVRRISDLDKLTVTRSELMLDIIDIKGGSFFSSINEKLMQPLKGSTGEQQ